MVSAFLFPHSGSQDNAACKPLGFANCIPATRAGRLLCPETTQIIIKPHFSGCSSARCSAARVLQLGTDRTSNNKKTRKVMNTLELKGNWNIAKGKLKQKYAQ